jgi:murein DD-endopeptidase MepM/ murein hydrolase activator NlpD
MKSVFISAIAGTALLFSIFFLGNTFAHAQTTADTSAVQAQIDAHNQQISALDAEIAGYQKQLTALSSQKQTLQSSLKSIDVNRQKTTAQITVIQNQIAAATLALQQLGGQITAKQAEINLDKQALAASIRQIANADENSFLPTLLASDNFVDVWNAVDTQVQLNEALQNHVQDLASATTQLADQQNQVSSTKTQLSTFNQGLVVQKGSLDANAQAKQQLIAQTASQQTAYQKLIATKKAQEVAFESELSALENSLKNVSASAIPKTGQGILAWPFSDAEMQHCTGLQSALGNPFCITQYFGNTPFATANAAIYSGMGHDGIDIGVPIGTPVQAALAGVVADTGNTDLVKGCYSFGKWVMIAHANGLSTMYAHLSVISVSKGQAMATGDLVGYSGMTGYATGPHLHFGVYATAGVQFLTLNAFRGDTTTGCANATMPVAPKDAYLNPLSYL